MMNWLFDDARQAGDSTVLEDADNSYYYVLLFHDRFREDYNTVDVRHILIKPTETELSSEDEGYDAEVEKNKAEAAKKAQELLNEYRSGPKTEDAFAALAKENSADSNASEGGLYTQVYKGQMQDSFEDWCFADGRKAGDTGIVETTYGSHVMYYVGEDLPYWQVRCINSMNTQWETDIYEGATIKEHALGIKAIG